MVTLIATGHNEQGVCNSNELYKIIERIAPEVIFEEVPPNKFAAVYEGTCEDSLETCAIKMYLKKYPILHFPVDMEIDDITKRRFREDLSKISFIFNDYSSEYNYLSNQLNFLSEQMGFSYLNSDQCRELLERKHFLEDEILQSLNLEQLTEAYKAWLNFIDERRNEMIKNIYNHSTNNKYEKALFLIGAEHRRPLMDKINEFEKNNKLQLNWKFDYFK